MSEHDPLLDGKSGPNQDPGNPREEIYDKHIAHLVRQIEEACREHGVQYLCTFDITRPEPDATPLHVTSCVLDSDLGRVPRAILYASEVVMGERPMMPSPQEMMRIFAKRMATETLQGE